ncbi:hypothetical protein L1A08_09465 [Rubinisphaera sp. ICM_H10]|nr:hypothetical protein [Rubinisphaera margarita]
MLAMDAETTRLGAVVVLTATDDPDETVREWAVEAIENCGPVTSGLLPILVEHLHHTTSPTQLILGLKLLGRSKEQAAEFFPSAVSFCDGAHPTQVRSQACKTAVVVAGEGDRAELRRLLEELAQDDDEIVSSTATRMQSRL